MAIITVTMAEDGQAEAATNGITKENATALAGHLAGLTSQLLAMANTKDAKPDQAVECPQ